jgi:hypothetical protein
LCDPEEGGVESTTRRSYVGFCRYCGKKAGWFNDVHEACVASCQKGCEQVASLVAGCIREKLVPPVAHADSEDWHLPLGRQVWSEAKPTIDQITAAHRIPADDLHSALLRGWSAGAERAGVAEPLLPGRQAAIMSFARAMELADQETCKTDGFRAATLSVLLWSVMVHGDPTGIAYVSQHPFNLRSGESPIIFFGSVVYSQETVSRSYQGGYGGMSVRIGHGMYYHFGGFKGQKIDAPTLREIDYGGMLLTTQNIYFGGEHRTFRIPYERVVSFRPHADGIGLFRDTAGAKAEVFTVLLPDRYGKPVNAPPVIGWFLFNVAHFLAQPEARALYAK